MARTSDRTDAKQHHPDRQADQPGYGRQVQRVVGDVHDPDSYAHHGSGEPEQQCDGSADCAPLRTEALHRQHCEPGDEQYP